MGSKTGTYRSLTGAAYFFAALVLFSVAASINGMPAVHAADRQSSPADSVPQGFEGQNLTRYYYSEGIKSYKIEGDAPTAIGYFDLAIAGDSLHAPSYYQAANALITLDPQAALKYSARAMELDSTNVWYSGLYARLLVYNGDYNRARRIYEKLIRLEPRSPENYAMLALLYETTGQPYAAIATLEKAENNIGKYEQLSRHKRDLMISAGLTEQAIEEATGIVEAYPYDYEGYLALAELYAETRRDSLAAANYNMAASLNPDGLDVLGSTGEFYRRTGQSEKYLATAKKLVQNPAVTKEMKIKIFRDITSDRTFYRENYFSIRDIAMNLFLLYPDDYDMVSLYASNIRAWGNFDEAAEVTKQYISTPREDVLPYMDIINMHAYKQQHDSVKKYVETALERFPTDPELYLRLGGTLSYMEDGKGALKSYEKALKYAEGDSAKSVILGVIGDQYHKQENKKKAYGYYDKALALWDSNTMVLNNYAYFLSLDGNHLEKALSMAQKVMEQEPDNPTYIDTYGWVLFRMGRLEEAKAAIRQAITLDADNNDELLVHYGDILYELGDTYMATVYWKRALEAGHDEIGINSRLDKAAK